MSQSFALYFDSTLPGKEACRQSLSVRFVYTICLFLTLAAINYPTSMREGVPITTVVFVFLILCAFTLLIQFFIWRSQRNK